MKQYQVKLWKLTGSSLACYLRELVRLISQFKEQVRPEYFARASQNTQLHISRYTLNLLTCMVSSEESDLSSSDIKFVFDDTVAVSDDVSFTATIF
jgi:hypothetical protein